MAEVSIIVPIYNTEKYLKRCLDSVLNQTLKDIEVICINDGSTDNSAKILERYKDLKNIIIIKQKNSGLSQARNVGLECAKGEYVSFVDSDDFIDNNFIEVLYNAAKKESADVACAGIIRENNKKRYELFCYNEFKKTNDIKEKFILSNSPRYNFVWNKIYKRESLILANIKFVPGMIYEDMCFTPDILEKTDIMVVCPNTFYHYWKHSNTLIKKETDKSRADKILGYQYLNNVCKKYGINYNLPNEILYKEDYKFLGFKILRKYCYRATKKYYLFGIIPFFEKRRKI